METIENDPFAAGVEGGEEDDPFAPGADEGVEPDLSDPADDVAGSPDIPVVDREGAEVTPPPPGFEEGAPGQPPAPEADPPPPAQAATPDAPAPAQQPAEQPKKKRPGKSEPRLYKIMYQTDEKQWTEAPLDKAPQGVQVVKEEGENWVKCTTPDQARRIGFVVCGSPPGGITVWPVPKHAYRPRRVAPAPPAPEKTRLVIS